MTDSQQNGSKDERGSVLRAEEATVTAILQSKLTLQECLRENDRQLVAYRIAEIMVAAKELYTKELPRIAADRNSMGQGERRPPPLEAVRRQPRRAACCAGTRPRPPLDL